MHQVFLGIGGNIGNKGKNFNKVLSCVQEKLGLIVNKSSIYETTPWGFQSNDLFWNQVLLINTEFNPMILLEYIHQIESDFGRVRGEEQYTSREMDIDILYYDNIELENKQLIIPHPHIFQRLFVLIPLAEIAPNFIHPKLKKSNQQLLNICSDSLTVTKIKE